MSKGICRAAIGALILLWPLASAYAAPKALLISISEYQYPSAFSPSITNLNLPGVEKDIQKMLSVANQLGITQENTLTLSNQSATEKNIKWSIMNHLRENVTEEDRVLIYFSGHGSAIWDESGDEQDGKDEVLLAYDAEFVKHGETYELTGKIIDDDIGALLNNIPSKRVLFIVDACHSGNINKGFITPGENSSYAKYAANPYIKTEAIEDKPSTLKRGLWQNLASKMGFEIPASSQGRIFFTATSESGKTLSNKDGSIFTDSLVKELSKTRGTGAEQKLNLKTVQQHILGDLLTNFPQAEGEPQLFGDTKLIESGF